MIKHCKYLTFVLLMMLSFSLYAEDTKTVPPNDEESISADETKDVPDASQTIAEASKKYKGPSVGKGNYRVGLMGSIEKGRFARSYFESVGSFTLDTDFDYFVHKRLALTTRFSTTVIFAGTQSVSDIVWGAGIKGVFNFGTRILPYIKIIPSIHYFNLDSNGGWVPDDNALNFDLLAGIGLDVLLTRKVAVGFAFHYEVIFSDENIAVYSFPFGFSFYF